jgi:DNA-binding transcriptional LysR family regulator
LRNTAVFAEALPNWGHSIGNQPSRPRTRGARRRGAVHPPTRSVGLTEAGERFLSRAKPAFEELVAASAVARDLGQRPAGLLRLTVPRAVVPILLEPLIAEEADASGRRGQEIPSAADRCLVDLSTSRCRHGR